MRCNRFLPIVFTMVLLFFSSCTDLEGVESRLSELEKHMTALEKQCNEMNSNITTLQSIVEALQSGDYITSVTPITTEGIIEGYTISFSNAKSITIYHGKDGVDGHTPIIGIKKDIDGIWYWTVDGEWLLNDIGSKVKAVGSDGITPQLKIEDGYWFVSQDNGQTWSQLGRASGKDGDSIFQSVTVTDNDVTFVTTDGQFFKFSRKKDYKLSVLFIGSSFGVNTVIQFPALARAAGIDITVGNLYKGACTLSDIALRLKDNSPFEKGVIYDKSSTGWETSVRTPLEMMNLKEWDIIIVQRSAPGQEGGCDSWTIEMAHDLDTILELINFVADYNPKILFNSGFSYPVGTYHGSREVQLEVVEKIMNTSKRVQDTFGLEIIPSAIAVHNARLTSLAYIPTFNSMNYDIPDLAGEGPHLDTGVGSYILGCLLFEQICGKRFDMSILNVSYLPTLEDVKNNAGFFPDTNFTPITEEQARIAKYAAMSANKNPWQVNWALAELFP